MNRKQEPSVQLTDKVTIPPVKLIHLDNGVPVYVLNEGQQEVIKIELLFKAGKWYENKNLLADLTNRMLREGTMDLSAKQIADTFDYYGANVNYGAGFESGGAVLYSLSEQVDELLPLLFEIFTEASFPEDEFHTIVNNRKQRLKVDLEKNEFLANRNFVSALYGQKHPYGRVTEFDHFDKIHTPDLSGFYNKYYHGGNLAIIVSGKFDDYVITELNKLFGNPAWKREKADETILHVTEGSTDLVQHLDKKESVQSAIICGNISINKTHPDFLKLSVLNTVLGGYFGSRLMSNIREEKGYTYGIYSSFVSYPHGGFLEIATEVGKEVREATFKEIEKEIKLLRTEVIDAEELQIVKNYIVGKIMRSVDGPMKFSETLKGLILYNQSTDYIHEFLNTVINVKAEELQELAVKYLDYDKMYKISVG